MAKVKETVKPGNDVYTGLQGLTLLASVIGCVLLALDLNSYESRTPPPLPTLQIPSAQKTQSAPAAPRTASPAENKDTPETKDGKKDGAMREPLSIPAEPGLPKLPSTVSTNFPEPALLPKLMDEPKSAGLILPASATEPVKVEEPKPITVPQLKPIPNDDPPLSVKPYQIPK
ncbi:hypothetical protein KIH39_25585 [Telmatocola sphagniphila]|uniref:Uncharacterized protein n=1 Tax=Telmatocola sphagniphila TaxID=1123043 RepID=A0A8E6EXZ9_9BACT|nr:hypothetical protein [Telmatocola sphagniphila]QVL32168.1 hypothetical protein KIH39_25585 [Telmatocola sphagniphila]